MFDTTRNRCVAILLTASKILEIHKQCHRKLQAQQQRNTNDCLYAQKCCYLILKCCYFISAPSEILEVHMKCRTKYAHATSRLFICTRFATKMLLPHLKMLLPHLDTKSFRSDIRFDVFLDVFLLYRFCLRTVAKRNEM